MTLLVKTNINQLQITDIFSENYPRSRERMVLEMVCLYIVESVEQLMAELTDGPPSPCPPL